MEIIKLLTSGRIWWLAVTLHRRCIIIIYSFKIGWGGVEQKVCEQAPFCRWFLFLFPFLVADVSHLGGVNLPHKGGACLPRGHRLFMYQIYFLLPWPPRIHTAFITGGNENWIRMAKPHMHCVTRRRSPPSTIADCNHSTQSSGRILQFREPWKFSRTKTVLIWGKKKTVLKDGKFLFFCWDKSAAVRSKKELLTSLEEYYCVTIDCTFYLFYSKQHNFKLLHRKNNLKTT